MGNGAKISVIIAAALFPVFAVVLYNSLGGIKPGEPDPYATVDWKMLRELDLESGRAPASLSQYDGKKVKIPGFVVPLDDNDQGLAEFLLVPSPQACIHVPPPPANQMVLVRMEGGTPPQRSWGAVWVKGVLRITDAGSQYGKTSFRLYGEGAEPYKRERD